MTVLRIIAVLLALTLMLGEAYRSWGAGRPFYAWFDDQIMGAALIAGAWLMGKPTAQRHAFFGAAWAFNMGMLYPSFFGKLFESQSSNPGNFSIGFLTLAICILFLVSIVGTIASLMLVRSNMEHILS
jgi:hypothetical protein